MKILVVTDAWHPQINGVVRTYENLSSVLSSWGHEIQFFAPSDCSYTFPLPTYPDIRLGLFSSAALYKRVIEWVPDHIHIATEGPLGWTARRLCHRLKRPYTTAYHSHFAEFAACRLPPCLRWMASIVTRRVYTILARFHRGAYTTFVVTRDLANHLVKNGFRDNFSVMTRGVDISIFNPDGPRAFVGIPRPIALSVGRVSPEKNLEAFLDAPWLGSKVVVGDGPALASLKARYPHAYFVGVKTVHELADCYRGADVFVFPSLTDTFGLVIIEALACGLTVAGHPAMGPRSIVINEKLGVLHEILPHAMEKALSISDSDDFRHSFVQKTYDWQKVAKDFLSALPNYG